MRKKKIAIVGAGNAALGENHQRTRRLVQDPNCGVQRRSVQPLAIDAERSQPPRDEQQTFAILVGQGHRAAG